MNKKANIILDNLIIILGLAIVGIGFIMIFVFFGEINSDFQADADISLESKAIMSNYIEDYPAKQNNLFLLLLFVFWVGAIISSFMIDTHPIFFVIMLIILAFLLIIGGFVANMYEEFISDIEISSVSDKFAPINFVFTHYIETILVISSSVILALYGKSKI